MQYVEYVKMGLALLAYIVDLVKDLKAREQSGAAVDVSGQVDRGISLLQGIGKIAKVKELQGLELTELKPLIADFISKVDELKAVSK